MFKRLTIEIFICRSIEIHGYKYDYSKFIYKNAHSKSIIICPCHGNYLQSPDSHLRGSGCPKCGLEKVKMSLEEFIMRSNKIHNNKYDYSKFVYNGNNKKGIIICPYHGIFKQIPRNHLKGFGCSKCSTDKKCMKLEDFVERSNEIHNNKYDYSKFIYKNTYIKGIIICPIHGEFLQRPDSHLSGSGCPKCCNMYSKKCENWINSYNNPNIQKGTRIKIPGSEIRLELDGFDPDTNTIYEFYGDFWHGNLKRFNPNDINPYIKKTYKELYENTMKREVLIKDAGFNLITIWEKDWDNINGKKRI